MSLLALYYGNFIIQFNFTLRNFGWAVSWNLNHKIIFLKNSLNFFHTFLICLEIFNCFNFVELRWGWILMVLNFLLKSIYIILFSFKLRFMNFANLLIDLLLSYLRSVYFYVRLLKNSKIFFFPHFNNPFMFHCCNFLFLSFYFNLKSDILNY